MAVLADFWAWITDPMNWTGVAGIPNRLFEHIQISGLAVLAGALLAVPIGLYIGHARRFEFISISVGNIGRALPSFGVLALVFPFTFNFPGEIGFWPTLIALFLLAIPPVLTNTYTGVKEIEADTVEAARGMGMSGMEVLRQIEIPLATPLIVTGLRIAAVQVVATATLGALAAWGGLGRFIVDGFAAGDDGQLLAGAVLVGALAIVTEIGFGLLERALTPKGSAHETHFFEKTEPTVGFAGS